MNEELMEVIKKELISHKKEIIKHVSDNLSAQVQEGIESIKIAVSKQVKEENELIQKTFAHHFFKINTELYSQDQRLTKVEKWLEAHEIVGKKFFKEYWIEVILVIFILIGIFSIGYGFITGKLIINL